MEALQATRIAIKNILFATDFVAPANRALPFAVALASRFRAKLYVSHVIPREAYTCASPEAADQVMRPWSNLLHAGHPPCWTRPPQTGHVCRKRQPR